jgi:hypothetical protein
MAILPSPGCREESSTPFKKPLIGSDSSCRRKRNPTDLFLCFVQWIASRSASFSQERYEFILFHKRNDTKNDGINLRRRLDRNSIQMTPSEMQFFYYLFSLATKGKSEIAHLRTVASPETTEESFRILRQRICACHPHQLHP